jgi:hypothetical protein
LIYKKLERKILTMKKQAIENLAIEIRKMSRQSGLYLMLKRELSSLGYWKNKPRGDSSAGRKKLMEINRIRQQQSYNSSHLISDSDQNNEIPDFDF